MRWVVLAFVLCVGVAHAHEGADQRIATLDLQILAEPDAVLPRLERARLLRESGRHDDAKAALDAIAERTAGHPDLLLERGLLASASGNDPRPWLDQHLSSPSPRAQGYDVRAELHARGGRPHAALADRQGAWTIGPTPDRALKLSRAFEAARDPTCAVAALEDAEERLAGAIVIRLEVVNLLLRAGRPGDARDRALVLAQEETPDRWLLLARTEEALGNGGDARDLRRRALTLAERRLAERPTELRRQAVERARRALDPR